MRIEYVRPLSPVLEDVSYEFAQVSIGGVEIDCEAEESDASVSIPIMRTLEGQIVRGPLAPAAGAYVAEILIPPRRYERVEELNDENEIVTVSRPLPLECERIVLRLWPL